MGNAVAELKTFGWPMTSGHDDNGLAMAIRKTLSRQNALA